MDEQGAAQVDVRQALPRVADAAVDLDGDLAHCSRARARRRPWPRPRPRVHPRAGVRRPPTRRGARGPGSLEVHDGIGEQVLHGLERSDRRPYCLRSAGVRTVRSIAPRMAPTRSAQRRGEASAVHRIRSSALIVPPIRHRRRCNRRERHGRSGEVDAAARAGDVDRAERVPSALARPRAPSQWRRRRRRRRRPRPKPAL